MLVAGAYQDGSGRVRRDAVELSAAFYGLAEEVWRTLGKRSPATVAEANALDVEVEADWPKPRGTER